MIRYVSRATVPLFDFPADMLGPSLSRRMQRLADELLLDERIDHLCDLAGLPSREATTGTAAS
jgi:hypothetical protein